MEPSEEVCDRQDNDCDGDTDEDLVGEGVCPLPERQERLSCLVDLQAGEHDCPVGPAGETPIPELIFGEVAGGFNARVTVDLHNWREVELLLHAESPSGEYQLNIGDSSTNNGHGGDSGTQSYDCEFEWINDGQSFNLYPGDVGIRLGEEVVSFPNVLPASPESVDLRVVVHNGYLRFSVEGSDELVDHTLRNPAIFQIDEAEGEEEGAPNSLIYIGLGRVVKQPPGGRIGQGLVWAELSFYRHTIECRSGTMRCGPQEQPDQCLPQDEDERPGDDLDNDCDGLVDEPERQPPWEEDPRREER